MKKAGNEKAQNIFIHPLFTYAPNAERSPSPLTAFLISWSTLPGLCFFQFLLLADRLLPVTINVLFSTPSHLISAVSHKITEQWLTQIDAPYHMIFVSPSEYSQIQKVAAECLPVLQAIQPPQKTVSSCFDQIIQC